MQRGNGLPKREAVLVYSAMCAAHTPYNLVKYIYCVMIDIKNLSFHFGVRALFEDTSVMIQDGQKVGLVGQNGCGKRSAGYSGPFPTTSPFCIGGR